MMILVTVFLLVFVEAILITSAALAEKEPWKRTPRRSSRCVDRIPLPPERAHLPGEGRSQPRRLTG